jgi:hypothetical protein
MNSTVGSFERANPTEYVSSPFLHLGMETEPISEIMSILTHERILLAQFFIPMNY